MFSYVSMATYDLHLSLFMFTLYFYSQFSSVPGRFLFVICCSSILGECLDYKKDLNLLHVCLTQCDSDPKDLPF